MARSTFAWCATFFACQSTGCTHYQDGPPRYRVYVRVLDEQKRPVRGAFVAVDYVSGPRWCGPLTDVNGRTEIKLWNPHYSYLYVVAGGGDWKFDRERDDTRQKLSIVLDRPHYDGEVDLRTRRFYERQARKTH